MNLSDSENLSTEKNTKGAFGQVAAPTIASSHKSNVKQRARRRGLRNWVHRLAPARLTSRIILINILGLVILVSGILYFNQTRKGSGCSTINES